VARDRQRAKQRRAKRQPGSGGSRAARDVDREIGVDGDDVVDSPVGEGTAAPDPLENASAYVDEARLAEAGVPLPDDAGPEPDIDDRLVREPAPEEFEEDDDYARAPDEAQGDVPVRRRPGDHAADRSRGRLLTFLGHCADELKRVQWPDRRHVGQATAVVLGFVVLAGGYLGLLDALWRPLVEAIL